jgi:glycerol-3-phosphate cytidylyltransferase
MVRVLTYGTFDVFHVGHVRLLSRLREIGDHLTVAVSTDEFNAHKGKRSVIPFEDRCEVVRACRYVDRVIPETSWIQKRHDIRHFNIDVFGMGDDWLGRFDDLIGLCRVVYLPRTTGISSTIIRADSAALNAMQCGNTIAQPILPGRHLRAEGTLPPCATAAVN